MWCNTEERVNQLIKQAIDDLTIFDSSLHPEKYTHSVMCYPSPSIGIVQAFLVLLHRQQEIVDYLGLEYRFEPPQSAQYKLVKKGK